MKKFELRGQSGQEEDMVDGCQVGRLVNEWMKEAELSSLAHTLKGDGKVEILGYKDPNWMMDLG